MDKYSKAFALLLSMLVAMPSYAQKADQEEDDVDIEMQSNDAGIVEEDLTPSEEAPATVATPAPKTYSSPGTSDTKSEKVFDWSKYQNAKEVPHPFAEKGLMRITKDRTYIYKVDETDQKRAFSFRVGTFNPENLENPEADGEAGATFEENYDQSSNPAIMFDYEWQLWRMPIGKIGLRAGTGVFIAQGNGHFASAENRGKGLKPRELFTFWALPTVLGAVYRLQFWDTQLFVPYAEGGAMGLPFGEFRDDNRPPKWGGAFAGYYAGGLAMNLTYFDKTSGILLDREYGINRVFLTAEFRGIVAITQNYDFTSNLINGGLLMEF